MKQPFFRFCGMLVLGAACYIPQAGAFDFVRDGKSLVSVDLPPNASSTELFAKEEFCKGIRKITGAEVFDKDAPNVIVLGAMDSRKDIPDSIRKRLAEALPNDAFYIKEDGNKLYVIGNTRLAAFYGMCELLEKFGVRWFYQGELGEEYPSEKTLVLPALDDFQRADFRYRSFNVCGTSTDFPGMFEWEVRNKMQCTGAGDWQLPQFPSRAEKQAFRKKLQVVPSAGGHEWAIHAVPVSLFKEHPEYFIYKKKSGKRTAEGRVERCYSNPEVKRLAIEYYLSLLKSDPNGKIIICAHDDSDAFCECENCVRMGTYNGKFSVSNLFHTFNKNVLDEVVKQYPDAVIEIFAYWNYRIPPENPAIVYPYKNAYILYCSHQRCNAHDFVKENSCNRNFVMEMEEWKTRCPAVGLYDYRFDSPNYYAPFESVMASDMRNLKKMGCVCWSDETSTFSGCNWGTGKNPEKAFTSVSNFQSHYIAAKFLWNSSLDFEKIMDDLYEKYYGNAAAVMKKYHELRTRLWNAAPGHSSIGGSVRTAYCLIPPGADKELSGLLEDALKLDLSERVRQRILQDKKFLETFWRKPAEALRKRLSQAKNLVPQKADQPARIDGVFDESFWVKASPVTGFLVPNPEREPSEATYVRVAYDNANLYIAVDAENKKAWGPVKVEAREKDGPVWGDDSMEFFLLPPSEDGAGYHLMVNTAGTVYDAKCYGASSNTAWDSGAEVKVVSSDNVYRYEIRIPLASMNAKVSSAPWRFHAIRTTTNLQPPNTREWSSLDGLAPFRFDDYRQMVLGRDLMVNGNFSELVSQKIDGKDQLFPKNFEAYGDTGKNFRLEKTPKGNNLAFSGTLGGGITPPKDIGETGEYTVVIRAKGTSLGLRTWSWEGYEPRTNHRNLTLPTQRLTGEFKDYTFSFPYLPKEYHVVLWIDGNDVVIENVSATVQTENKK